MKSSKKIFPVPLGINWHEGMLLSQHHLQQNDLRQFHVLAHQIRLISSIHFGVCHLRIDNVAFADGLYRINEIEAVFPDGLIYSYFPDENVKLRSLEANLTTSMGRSKTEVTIYLTIAESIGNVSPILSNPPRYYSVYGGYIADENIPDNEIKIPRLFPNACLSIDTIPEMCIGFPLCKINRIDGVYSIKNWTPPCFFIAKHFPLWERCSMLALSLREKATFLSERLSNSSGKTNIRTGTEQLLKQILMILPPFEALVYSDNIRPYELYEELAEILGAVSVFRPTDMIPVMHPYNHNDIDGSIYPLMNIIEKYISIIDRGFSVLAMNKKERFFYYYINTQDIALCSSTLCNGNIYVGLKGSNNNSYSKTEAWMMNAVLVSDFAVDNVRDKRIKGATRSIANEEIVSQIMPGNGVILFEVYLDNNFIMPEQNIHVFNPGDSENTRPIEINLYIPRQKQE
jgi:type VI secretion system protein ImpJ